MSAQATESALNELAHLLAERTGLTGLTLSHENLQRALTLSHLAEPEDLARSLREGRLDWDALIDALTVRETYFFRHPDHFEELRRRVLPTLHGQLRDRGSLRVWSAGCASGEEAYTLAIVFEAEGLLDRVQIVASDISGAALERGQSGQYRDWSLRSLQPELRARYFQTRAGIHTIREGLRSPITWRQLNLAEPGYPSLASGIGHFSLVFCRNVLMFFDAKSIQQVATRLWASLSPGGWLFLGPSDPNISAYADFEVHVTQGGLVFRRPTDAVAFRRESALPPLLAAAPEAQELPAVARDVELRPASKSNVDVTQSAHEVRTACNQRGPEAALAVCETALASCEDSLELHHLHALMLWELRRYADAASAMRRVLYLDRDNAVAHFGLATLLERQGSFAAARRSFQNTLSACDQLAPDAPLSLGDGICASGLHAAALDGLLRVRCREAGSP
jgi:chemotaxis protein methyltransferase CheR